MKYAVILPLLTRVPAIVKVLRRDWDDHVDVPAHVTLGTFEAESPEGVMSALHGCRTTRVLSKGTFYDSGDDAIFAYRAIGCSVVANQVGRTAGPTWRLPKSGFHITIAWGRRFQRASKKTRERIASTPVQDIDTLCDRAWVYQKVDKHWKKIRVARLLPIADRKSQM